MPRHTCHDCYRRFQLTCKFICNLCGSLWERPPSPSSPPRGRGDPSPSRPQRFKPTPAPRPHPPRRLPAPPLLRHGVPHVSTPSGPGRATARQHSLARSRRDRAQRRARPQGSGAEDTLTPTEATTRPARPPQRKRTALPPSAPPHATASAHPRHASLRLSLAQPPAAPPPSAPAPPPSLPPRPLHPRRGRSVPARRQRF